MKGLEYLPLEACVDRQLYRLHSRNLAIGVYSAASRSFYGIRTKFGQRFVDDEYHWDASTVHGTAKPLEPLGEAPPDGVELAASLGSRCDKCDAAVGYSLEAGRWQHDDGSPICDGMIGYRKPNQALFDWLDDAERRHAP